MAPKGQQESRVWHSLVPSGGKGGPNYHPAITDITSSNYRGVKMSPFQWANLLINGKSLNLKDLHLCWSKYEYVICQQNIKFTKFSTILYITYDDKDNRWRNTTATHLHRTTLINAITSSFSLVFNLILRNRHQRPFPILFQIWLSSKSIWTPCIISWCLLSITIVAL